MINVAVIGVGSMGQNHARIFFHSDNARLVAVSDNNKDVADKVAKKYNCNSYQNYDDLLKSEQIDAVSIAVPTSLHKEIAIAALNHKKHVLLEKPIASNEQEAQEIIECAKKNNVKLMIGHIERFNTAIIELKNRLEQGDLGDIYRIDVQRIGPFPGRVADVGVIIDLSVHDLDIIDYLINVPPSRIFAETQQRLHPRHEDAVTALIRYPNSILAVLNINYLSPTKIRQLQVFGKRGMFKVNYLDQELYFYENTAYNVDDWSSVCEGDMKKIIIPKKEPLQVEIEAFLSSVKTNTPPPVTGEQGLSILKIAHTIIQSAKENRIIEHNLLK
jgi:predicted dehydrogenase